MPYKSHIHQCNIQREGPTSSDEHKVLMNYANDEIAYPLLHHEQQQHASFHWSVRIQCHVCAGARRDMWLEQRGRGGTAGGGRGCSGGGRGCSGGKGYSELSTTHPSSAARDAQQRPERFTERPVHLHQQSHRVLHHCTTIDCLRRSNGLMMAIDSCSLGVSGGGVWIKYDYERTGRCAKSPCKTGSRFRSIFRWRNVLESDMCTGVACTAVSAMSGMNNKR